jgi:hypothetical protein
MTIDEVVATLAKLGVHVSWDYACGLCGIENTH